eukprot:TRINITY_DN4890_c1_g1_i6.p1 TRINITY_DN4890_c1_g1~~TRINITY_DN4890_c1_g1_i6.p1  ORF type:complete len:301 (+),score=56.90 TRINITY_DN4890_c1_g1_i6:80-982(+)
MASMADAGVQLELVCLGVGVGKSMVYDGQPSSSFLLRTRDRYGGVQQVAGQEEKGQGILLLDCGLGVTRACLQHVEAVPPFIYVSHNHTDHAGELPVVLSVERARPGGCKRTVIAEKQVAKVLQERRLYETTPKGAYAANWFECAVGEKVTLGNGLILEVVGPCQHGELCYGLLVYKQVTGREDELLFGFTADTGFSPSFMEKFLPAPVLLADARRSATHEHASFEELRNWRSTAAYKGRTFIYHYGLAHEAPSDADLDAGMEIAKPGEILASWPFHRVEVRDRQDSPEGPAVCKKQKTS